MKTQERFLADQLLAILHGCPGALTTAQIASAAPPLLEIYAGCDPTWHVRSRSSRTLEEICCGEHHLHVRTRFAREIYQTLRTMAAGGEVIRAQPPGSSDVSWRARTQPRFLDELEACLALPDAASLTRDRCIRADCGRDPGGAEDHP